MVWLDAGDSNAVTQSGGAVSYWRDKSSLGIDVCQNTVANQPTYESNVQNGLPAMRYTTSQMMRSTSNFTVDKAQTWFVSFRPLATGNIFFVEQGPNTNTSDGQFLYGGNNSLMYMKRGAATRFIDDPAGRGTTPFAVNGTWYVCGFATSNINTASTDVYWSINGVSRTCAITSVVAGTATNQLYINNTARVPGSNYMGEIIIYNQALPANQIRLVERYLARKWGVALPATHSYFSVPAAMRQFNPLDVSGCALWLDAADSRTFTFSSGTTISRWDDKSGNSRHGTVFNGGPSYSSLSQSVVFGGGNGIQTPLSAYSPAESGFFVATFSNVTPINTLIGQSDANGGRQFRVQAGKLETLRQDVAGILFTGPTTLVNNTRYICEYVNSGARITHYVQGAVDISGTGYSWTPTSSTSCIGLRFGPTEGFTGNMNEIVIYDRAVSDAERQRIELYLAEKWGLRTSLSTENTMRLYRSLTPVFNPTLISNCGLWLDAADRSTLTFSGSNVTAWSDKSGLGYIASNIGTITTTTRNNTNVLSMGSNRMSISNFSQRVYSTTFMVGLANVGRLLVSLGFYNSYIYTGNDGLYYFSNAGFIGWRDSVSGNGNPVVSGGQYFLFAIGYNGGSNASFYSVNGVPRSTIVGEGAPVSDGTLTSTLIINGNPNGGFDSTNFCEMVVFNQALNAQQARQVEAYLAKKWNIALPSNHPYYSTPV